MAIVTSLGMRRSTAFSVIRTYARLIIRLLDTAPHIEGPAYKLHDEVLDLLVMCTEASPCMTLRAKTRVKKDLLCKTTRYHLRPTITRRPKSKL